MIDRPCRTPAAGLAAVLLLLPGCPPAPKASAPPPPAQLVLPLNDAEAGEELRARAFGGHEWVWRVSSANDDAVEIDFHVVGEGAPKEATRLRFERNAFGVPAGYVVRKVLRDRLEHAGRSWDCWIVQAHSRRDVRWYWITEELPGPGFLKMAVVEKGIPVEATAAWAIPEGSSFPK